VLDGGGTVGSVTPDAFAGDGVLPGTAPALPTLEQVARRAGVSIATASRVVTGSVPVSPERRHRVERAIADLGYVPDERARDLRRGAQKAVALLVARLDSRREADLFRMLRGDLALRGLTLLALEALGDAQGEREAVDVLLRGGIRALVVSEGATVSGETIERLHRRGVRVVLVGGGDAPVGVTTITVERDGGGEWPSATGGPAPLEAALAREVARLVLDHRGEAEHVVLAAGFADGARPARVPVGAPAG
jgi:transcriptional regulator with XRE-family HTH domain